MVHPSCGVLIAYLGSKSFVVKNKRNEDADRILILDVTIEDSGYILVKIYSSLSHTYRFIKAKIHECLGYPIPDLRPSYPVPGPRLPAHIKF